VPFRDAFPILHTTDLKRAARFYVERLGFEERYRFPEGEAAEFVLVGLEMFELGLTKSRKVTPPGRVALWLYTEEVERRSSSCTRQESRS
jgi:catechol 2,3-dioxygenase-like lactoylglutathione lyase family enzyme